MSKELVIGSSRHETKVAVLEEDQLVEVFFQRGNEYALAGSIHKGRVTRVLPGMQSAFVDLGLERDTFLYVTDFFEEHEDIDTVDLERPAERERRDRESGGRRDREGNRKDRESFRTEGNRGERGERGPASSVRGASEEPVHAFEDAPKAQEAAAPVDAEALDVRTGGEPAGPSLEPTPERGATAEPPSLEPPAQTAGLRLPERPIGSPLQERAGDSRLQEREGGRDVRGDGRGDPRGRRSRRRRGRGRGFPEQKYAQPNQTAAVNAPPSPVITPQEARPMGDVVLLPGESLAKYRSAPTRHEAASERAESRYAPLSKPEFEPHEFVPEPATIDPLEQAAIEAEADELELAEKVFGHHDEEDVDVEQKIEEIKRDQPEPEVEALTTPEDREFGSPEPILGAGRAEVEDLEAEDFTPLGLRSGAAEPDGILLAELPDGEILEVDEFEPVDFEPADIQAREFEAGEASDEAIELEAERPVLGEAVDPLQAESLPPQVQTATMREQGGRYMHRLQRRPRRRRGGTSGRFSQGSEPAAGESGVAAGAATALEPETVRKGAYEERSVERPERVLPSIADLLKAGQEIIVQIAKEPLGQKGARITSHIALPGRYVVFMPSVSHLGVSRKVASDEERQRLKRILQTHRAGTTGGFIVRTAGEGVSEEEIAADMNFLYTLWLDIREKAEKKPAPALLHYDLDIVQRILRDQVTEEFKAIWVDNEDLYENVLTFMQRFQPSLVSRVKMYTRSAPIFDAFNITQELEKALRPKVWLKSGGYIVINQTEALVAIDINTGKYVGKSNRLEDTIVKTNTEAVKEIVRQIRLRDLGGIIVVDFIDMDERKNRQKVMQALEDAMRADKAPYKILQFNDFGLVAITRKRVKQSLERTLCAPCPYCEAAGYVKSVQTVISEIIVEAQKIAKSIDGKDVMLRVHPEVAKVLKASDNQYLEELEQILRRPVLVSGDATLHHEKFDLA